MLKYLKMSIEHVFNFSNDVKCKIEGNEMH